MFHGFKNNMRKLGLKVGCWILTKLILNPLQPQNQGIGASFVNFSPTSSPKISLNSSYPTLLYVNTKPALLLQKVQTFQSHLYHQSGGPLCRIGLLSVHLFMDL
jgi:hypothetical protein